MRRSKNKWDGICARLNGWEDVDIVSNQILWDIEKFKEGTITGEEIERLKRSLVEVQKEAEKDRQEASSEIRSMNKEADVLEKERERVFCVQNSNGWEEVQEPEVRSRKHTLTASRQCRRSRTFRKKRKWYWIP